MNELNLKPFVKDITVLNPMSQRLYFHPNHWQDFNYPNIHLKNEMNFIVDRFGNSITRQDIIQLLRDDESSLIRGFLLTMIWGHGYPENGKADNRGPWKVSQMLNNHDESLTLLETVKNHLMSNNIKSAHLAFKKMERCRVNFFSKYLYFLGRSLNMQQYPLIFDARVSKSIPLITSNHPELLAIIDFQPKQDPDSYDHYVREIHKVANRIDVDADKIELFLFNGSF